MISLDIICEAMNPAAQKLRSTRATVIKAKLEIPARFSSQLWMRISKLLQHSSFINVDDNAFRHHLPCNPYLGQDRRSVGDPPIKEHNFAIVCRSGLFKRLIEQSSGV
jgi:hypothetical protein